MALLDVKKLLLLLVVNILNVKANDYSSVSENYCTKDKKVFTCDYAAPKKDLLLVTETDDDLDKIFVSNFPKLAIRSTDCKNLTVISSNITFEEGPTAECQGKVLVLRNSYTDTIPRDVIRLVAFKSYIKVLDNGNLKFASIHNSTIKSVADVKLLSADITVVDSVIASLGKVSIDENSSVRLIKSEVTFGKGGYFDVHGKLTLDKTDVDITSIHLNPTAKFQMFSPKASWYKNITSTKEPELPEKIGDNVEKNDVESSIFNDPDYSSGTKLNMSILLVNIVLLAHVSLVK